MTENLNTLSAEIMVDELVRCGVTQFCIAPGSRSTPLVVAAARNPHARVQMFFDERGAAFFALGFGRATRTPAVVITTSGTAVANLFPAVAEASIGRVPMLLLTADRPPELTDTGANQTMIQPGIFGSYTRWQFDLPCPTLESGAAALLTTIDHAVQRANGIDPGPVHLNCRFREPLEPTGATSEEQFTRQIARWLQTREPFSRGASPQMMADDATLDAVAEVLAGAQRGMIFIGELTHERDREPALALARHLNYALYADVTSGLQLGAAESHLLRHYDPTCMSDRFNEQATPDVVLHLGGAVVSKRVGEFLSRCRPKHHIVVKPFSQRYDPVHTATWQVQAEVEAFSLAMMERVSQRGASTFAEFYSSAADELQTVIDVHVNEDDALTEPFVMGHLSCVMPQDSGLFLSNSMPVRDMDLYADVYKRRVAVGVNRGVSGIDGVLATACGFAKGRGTLVTAILGDVAMLHDLNSLSILAASPQPVIAVILNNNGGGIFDFLPISRYADVFEKHFITPHGYTFAGACSMFRLPYRNATSKAEFIEQYELALRSGQSCVIEVTTDRATNFALRKRMKQAILKVIDKP